MNSGWRTRMGWVCVAGGLAVGGGGPARALDLSQAAVVFPPNLSGPERQAVTMLVEEVAKRTHLRWPTSSVWPPTNQAVIVLGPRAALAAWAPALGGDPPTGPAAGPEGFTLAVRQADGRSPVVVAGNDSRGVLFGVGWLLRQLHLSVGSATLPDGTHLATAPHYRLRGHQLGYRPKTHAYDAWDLTLWEQYIRDLAVFGCNTVELIPPRSDDEPTSPHFPLPPMPILVGMSRLLDSYGLDVWLWYPAMDPDYANPATVQAALQEWGEVFRQMPRLDAVFVPGGDPGHTRPGILLEFLAQETKELHRYHPRAQMWVSPQSFNQAWLAEFLDILQRDPPAWLSGVVFGPQVRISLPELRAAVPAQYPIRNYPDITHCRQCQYPVPNWDVAFALTEGREVIDPRPLDEANIFRLLQPYTIGFTTYSEGCNDDVNKMLWSALGWNPDADVGEILREYSRYFIGDRYTDDFAQGLLALEANWRGPLLPHQAVETTLAQFQDLERAASPQVKLNWRFQMALYRAYYDAYTRQRLSYETGLEARAREVLRAAPERGAVAALDAAQRILERATSRRVAADWRARVFELGEALYQSIRMQLSVPRYQAIAVDRGANLDTIDYPLNNRRWLLEQFNLLRRLPAEADRLKGIARLVNWTDPGPGGFYDDLGNLAWQPHLVRGPGPASDPAFLHSALVGFEEGEVVDEPDEKPTNAWRLAWMDHAETLNDTPLAVRYEHLDPTATYRLRVVYGGDSPKKRIRLVANGSIPIHPLLTKPWPIRPIEFDLPRAATAGGQLTLEWHGEPGLGGNGRGCQVSELWLLKTPDGSGSP